MTANRTSSRPVVPRISVALPLTSARHALAIALPITTLVVGVACRAAETGERDDAVASLPPPVPVRTSSRLSVLPPAPVRSTCGIPGFHERLLQLVNALRSRGADCGQRGMFGPAGPVGWNARLTWSADVHAVDMARHNYFSHTGAVDGRTVEHRLAAVGQPWGEYAENLAAGLTSVDAVLARWLASPAHCANLMNPAFTDIGAACAPAAATSRFKTYWALDLTGP